jgi:hypothetical protein
MCLISIHWLFGLAGFTTLLQTECQGSLLPVRCIRSEGDTAAQSLSPLILRDSSKAERGRSVPRRGEDNHEWDIFGRDNPWN